MTAENQPRIVTVESVPPQNNTYSQAVILGNTVYISGQLGVGQDGTLPTEFSAQVRQALENVRTVVEAAGSGLERVAKVNIYVTDFGRLAEMNLVYREFFPHRPAKTTVEVARLDKGAQIEVEVVAAI